MKTENTTEKIHIHQLEIDPTILQMIPLKVLMELFQSLLTISTLKALAEFPIFVSRKKGMRKNTKYVVSQGILVHLAFLKLQEQGEPFEINVVIVDSVDENFVLRRFLFELSGLKRSQDANAVIAKIFKEIETLNESLRRPPSVNASLKDITHKRSDTIRKLTGFDGRSFQNAMKSNKPDQDVLDFLEGFV